ncbi:MAG TPA: CAP domain-containing protein [Clostridiaceae bacterium]|nr:CAP domain-containing protein [Clostridiaceae bacterium]
MHENKNLYSDGHRKNIKTESFTYIGIGYTYRDSLGNWEQLFASSKDSECVSIEYDADNYPGVNRAKSSTDNTSATNETGQGSSGETSSGETPSCRTTEPSVPVTAPVTANPSDTRFVMNGKTVSVTAAYNINGTNYLQIRAIAAMLNGTAAQFDVAWNGQYAIIEPGKSYSGTVTETRFQSTTDVRNSDTKFKMNGEVFTFYDARPIDGDTNYIQLREFAQKLSGTPSQFNVYWDNEARQAVIQPGVYYTGEAPVDNPSDDTNSKEKEIYYIKASKNENFVIDVSGASEEDGAKRNLRAWNGNDNQKIRLKIRAIYENCNI